MPTNLNDIFVREQDRLSERIYKKSINTSPWNSLVPKETWPDGLSDSIQVMTVERNLPDNLDVWETLTPNENSNNCVPVADVVPTGQTLRSFNLAQKALESPEVCVTDTRNSYRTQEQIRIMYENLTHVVRYTWKRRAQVEYTRLAEHKIVATAGLPENSSSFPTIAATSILTQGILNKIYSWLLADSAEMDGGSLGKADGAPQFILITSMETSDAIMREDGNVNSFLWNKDQVPELLKPLGVNRAFRGFYHMKDALPPRYDFVDGAWVEISPYLSAAASKGTKAKINPAYMAAPFEDSFVFLPSVFSFMVPQPISTMGSGTSWKPQSYTGDFRWLNIANRTDNPDNSIGFYRALLQSGSKPVHPEFGFVIRHLRCWDDFGSQACATVDAPASSDLGSGDSFFVA